MTKAKKKKRLLPIPKLEKKLDRIFSAYIRLRDCDINGNVHCVTCNTLKHWRTVHCGHFVKRSYRAVRWDETNCAAQCRRCNRFMGGRQDDFSLYIIDQIGLESYREIMRKKYLEFHVTRDMLNERIAHYSRLLETMGVRIG